MIGLIVNIQGTKFSANGAVKVAALPRTGDYLDLSGLVGTESLSEYVTVLNIVHPVYAADEAVDSSPLVVAATSGKRNDDRLLAVFEELGWEIEDNASTAKGGAVSWG